MWEEDPELEHLKELYEEAMVPDRGYRPPATPEEIEESRRLMTPAMKRTVAYHEAGHAVICWRLSVPITRITIEPNGHTLGVCAHGTPDLLSRDLIRQGVRIGMAGQIAERLSRGEWPKRMPNYSSRCYAGDLKSINRGANLPECIGRSEEANTAWRRWQWICVRDDLREHWPVADALAKKLLERETLVSDEVYAVIREVSARDDSEVSEVNTPDDAGTDIPY